MHCTGTCPKAIGNISNISKITRNRAKKIFPKDKNTQGNNTRKKIFIIYQCLQLLENVQNIKYTFHKIIILIINLY